MVTTIVTILLISSALILGYTFVDLVIRQRQKIMQRVSLSGAEALSEMLAKRAVNLVTGKYDALVCDQLKEIEINLLVDLRETFYDILKLDFDDAENLSLKIADPVKVHLFREFAGKECEYCEERTSRILKNTKNIILEIFKKENLVKEKDVSAFK